jgi:cobalamin-dependent methionine synthase I
MASPGLKIIGEAINDSVPSTHLLYEKNDMAGILNLAKDQDKGGAMFIDVNVGRRDAKFMAEMVKKVQTVTAKPLSVDSPDPALAEAGLKAYDPKKAGGAWPILNSISPLRMPMFDLAKIQPFMPILLVSERMDGSDSKPNHTVADTYETAKAMLAEAQKRIKNFSNDRAVFDVGIAPLATDSEGGLKRTLESIRGIHEDPDFKGVHMSLGLSNFSVMLPSKCADGSPVKGPLESAFLTLANPLGLDMVIGSVKRNYQVLSADHPAMKCVQECLTLEGYDVIMRVRDFYA